MSATKETTFKAFMKVLTESKKYDDYIRITQLPDRKIGLLTILKKKIEETGDYYHWSEFCIIPGDVYITQYKTDMRIPVPYVFNLHYGNTDTMITLLSLFNPDKERIRIEYFPKNNSKNNEETGLNQDMMSLRIIPNKHSKKREYEVSIKGEWIHPTTMLINADPSNNWSTEIKETYLKSSVFTGPDLTIQETRCPAVVES